MNYKETFGSIHHSKDELPIRCIAFDCFGTIFRMDDIPREEIRKYVDHVNLKDFSPFVFSESWLNLLAHPDSATGIDMLQKQGYMCVTLSNGSTELLSHLSKRSGIFWDRIVDLVSYRVYKPHRDAYLCIEKDIGISPVETLMITANPTFGDLEGASSVGMRSRVVRNGPPETIIDLAEEIIKKNNMGNKEI